MNKKLPIFLMAFLVGLIYILPHSLLYRNVDSSRIYLPYSFAETLYAVQVKEVLEGHLSIGDPQFWEHKYTFPPVFPIVPIWIIAILSKLFGSIDTGFLVSDFIFPVLLFIVFFALGIKLAGNKEVATLASLCTLTLYSFFAKFPPLTIKSGITFIREITLLSISRRLPFYRTPNPQISLIFLVGALFLLYKLWEKPSKWSTVCTGVLGSLLYFVYFYHITYFIMTLSVLLFFSLLKRNKKWPYLLTATIILIFVGFVYLRFTSHEPYKTLLITGGRFEARYIDWLYTLRYGVIALMLYFFLRKTSASFTPFLVSLAIAGILVMNFQLLTGWTLQPGHYPQTTIEPLLIFSVILALLYRLKNYINFVYIHTATFLLLIYAILTQVLFPAQYRNTWSISEDNARVLQWISHSLPPQMVVVSLDIETLAYIPILTSANIFLPIEEYHYASIDEIWQRILYAYKLYLVPDAAFDPSRLALPTFFELTYNVNQYKHAEFTEYESETIKEIKKCYPSLCSGLYALPRNVIREMKERYRVINNETNPFRVDYAIYSDWEKKLGAFPPFGELVFVSGTYRVYRLIRPMKYSP